MDKYGVQNGTWRKHETEITIIKRIIYTKNKTWKKEFEGVKLTINKISTTPKNCINNVNVANFRKKNNIKRLTKHEVTYS